MIAAPSILILILIACLSCISAAVVRKQWQRNIALSLAGFEIAMAFGLAALVLLY